MPRVEVKRKNKAGRERSCGKCGERIETGSLYKSWSFRYGGTHFRCVKVECQPRQSDLTQSIMAEVYLAVENAEDSLPTAESVGVVKELVESVADAAMTVSEQYREAAESFGGGGENGERADELEGWSDELASFDPEEESGHLEDELAEQVAEAVQAAREEAEQLVGGCPL